ncbi:MAG: MFS transporter [Clostridia bacterium]|nr:MFS transporter [Clostridia bacterium]
MTFTHRHTLAACYIGYITQAIVNNLAPLLFVTFQSEFALSLPMIGALISVNFVTQIITDLVSAKYVDKIGYRAATVLAHILATLGLVGFAVLPSLLPNAYAGVLVAMVLCAIGGGLNEVLISPIVESLPGDAKAQAMSLLHSFYCWGHMGVVLLSTLFFATLGVANWRVLCVLWAIVPLLNTFLFAKVPLRVLVEDEQRVPLGQLFRQRIFWLFMILMIAAGASEQAMSQWSSLFAELGLGVSKSVGDLLGPCAFALLMGLARLFYGVRGAKLDLHRCLVGSSLLCIFSYLLAVFAPHPILSLAGCALTGLSVGMMWPGTFSLAAAGYPQGGTAMFAMLAFAGDVGCASGPAVVSAASNLADRVGSAAANLLHASTLESLGLKLGLLVAICFPVIMVTGVTALKRSKN